MKKLFRLFSVYREGWFLTELANSGCNKTNFVLALPINIVLMNYCPRVYTGTFHNAPFEHFIRDLLAISKMW